MKAPTPRDWAAMSWYQRDKWMRTYAATHREPDLPRGKGYCGCGNPKRSKANLCQPCYRRSQRARDQRIANQIDRYLSANPTATFTDVAAECGFKHSYSVTPILKRAGRHDLHLAILNNGKQLRWGNVA